MSIIDAMFGNDKRVFQTYDDISLYTTEISEIDSRTLVNPGVNALGANFSIPLMASPMPDVCNGRMANTLAKLGVMGIIHRFQSLENQVAEYTLAVKDLTEDQKKLVGCAIGVGGDYRERFMTLHNTLAVGCNLFCLDTANGASLRVKTAIEEIRKLQFHEVYLIAGNIFSREGYRYLANLNVDAVRVGIAGGSVCTTKTETGMYLPMVSCIEDIVLERREIAIERIGVTEDSIKDDAAREIFEKQVDTASKDLPLIIADGGIRIPSDMHKAIALGADLVMGGNIFAGTEETPGLPMRDKTNPLQKYKIYRGAASFSVQLEHSGDEPEFNEGEESFVPYKGSVEKVVRRFIGGLRSSMSYANAMNLTEYRDNVLIIDI